MAGGVYGYSASYDANVRLTGLSLTNTSTSAVLFRSLPGYDGAGNVTAVSTTLAAGTDNQAFCYDEQNRLTWATATGTPPCGGSIASGSLTSAQYAQTFTYDTLDRLTLGPTGAYTYGDTAHLHAATSVGSGYTSKYDALGDMTCRAPTSATTCAGTPNGAQITYDNEGRLSAWQDMPTSPTTTDAFLYDGEGNRVEQQATTGGSITTTTVYVGGGAEEVVTNGSGTTLTKYFSASGLPAAMRTGTGGSLSYLASDKLGSVSESLDSSGSVTSQQLYGPYGASRYASGSSPTSYGYTGQRADAGSGLDYYNARYYDPVVGQFTSADSVADGLNRYGYVRGNPETATDSSGHMACSADFGQCGAPTHHKGKKPEIVPGPKAGDHTGHKPCPGSCSPVQRSTSSGSGNTQPKCDAKCQDAKKTSGAWNNIVVGAALLIGGLGGIVIGCLGSEFMCPVWVKAATGIVLQGSHQLMDGVNALLELNGSSPMIRLTVEVAMIYTDIVQMIFNAVDLSDTLNEIGEMMSGIKGLGGLVKAIAEGGPKAGIIGSLREAESGALELLGAGELRTDVQAFLGTANEVLSTGLGD